MTSNPTSPEFYEPTWWRIGGQRVHCSHLIVFRNGQVPDILKPSYMFGGGPVPQRIAERQPARFWQPQVNRYNAGQTSHDGPEGGKVSRMAREKHQYRSGSVRVSNHVKVPPGLIS